MRRSLLSLILLGLLAGCDSDGAADVTSAQSQTVPATTVAAQQVSDTDSSQADTLARAARPAARSPQPPQPPQPPVFEARSYDGKSNNESHPTWGSVGVDFSADVARAYADGQDDPSGAERPGPRTVSNGVIAQTGSVEDAGGRSAFLWVWGQFLDHDLDLTLSDGNNDFPISIPAGDPYFDPSNSGTQTMPFSRSIYRDGSSPRAQVNSITSYIDASQVYGSDEATARSLRSLTDGLMLTSAGDLPPREASGQFLCGDIRANENLALTAMQTVFLREHNRKARLIKQAYPGLSDEEIYQRARKYVGALIQSITYREFLPVLLGQDAVPAYAGYKDDVDAGVGILFSTAAYRLGHSQVGSDLPRLDSAGNEIPEGNLKIADAFFNPDAIVEGGGIEPLLRGLSVTASQATDNMVIDDLRNFLFGPPGAGGMDLPSLNIQRGRDHGLPSYNAVRTTFGRAAAKGMADLTRNPSRQQALASVYASPDRIDPWVGLLSEDPVPGAAVGPTLQRILREQFRRTRDGDRFFYLNDPALKTDLKDIEASTLARVVARNTGITGLNPNLFLLKDAHLRPHPVPRPRQTPPHPIPIPQV
jgi:hypothetical protein